MNPHGQGFQMFAVPPWMFGGQPQQAQQDRVPRRVAVAMDLLQHFTIKTMTRGIANDVSIQEIEGQRLEVEETEAHLTACKLLTQYMKGDYKPTTEERKEVKSVGSIISCPQCGASGRVPSSQKSANACPLCKGTGYLSVTPANPEGT